MSGKRPRWEQDPGQKMEDALRMMLGYLRVKRNSPIQEEVANYSETALHDVVFESNNMEGVGTRTAAETRALARAHLPSPPTIFRPRGQGARKAMRVVWLESGVVFGPSDELSTEVDKETQGGTAPLFVVTHGKSNRELLEVLSHETAMYIGQLRAIRFSLKRLKFRFGDRHVHSRGPRLFDQPFVRLLHGTLMGANRRTPYRSDVRVRGPIGESKPYMAPSRVPKAMVDWVRMSNALMLEPINPIVRAAKISHRIALLHPFEDGNGRLSRLIMNTCLRADEVPFPVCLKSAAKWKRRYVDALRLGDDGDLESISYLIALQILEGFETINTNLRAAGLAEIKPAKK